MKGFPLPVIFFCLFAIMICFPAVSPGEGMAPSQVVETEGSAPVSGSDLARARSAAVRDALQKAVEQVTGHWLSPQDTAEKSPALKEQIADRAEGFIREYRIVSEATVLDVHTVVVRASVLVDNLRNDLLLLGLIRSTQLKLPVNRIFLTIRGIRTYGEYVKCRGILKDRIPGIREIIPREASWRLARFDIAVEGTVPTVAEQLREKLAAEIQFQDDRVLEVYLK
jgi:hypothetical protein